MTQPPNTRQRFLQKPRSLHVKERYRAAPPPSSSKTSPMSIPIGFAAMVVEHELPPVFRIGAVAWLARVALQPREVQREG